MDKILKKIKKNSEKFIVFNDDKEVLDYKRAVCCNPIPGDLIFGFITVVDGIKVHRSDCPNPFNYVLIMHTEYSTSNSGYQKMK